MPWLPSPADQLKLAPSVDHMFGYTETFQNLMIGELWRTCNGDLCRERRDDPEWVDATRALVIATSVEIGADLVVVLDLRTSPENPRVVATAVCGEHVPKIPGTAQIWIEVAETFEGFAAKHGL